jgi:hypothetical protein
MRSDRYKFWHFRPPADPDSHHTCAEPTPDEAIANNTPLVALWVLDRLELLRDLYGEIRAAGLYLEQALVDQVRQMAGE